MGFIIKNLQGKLHQRKDNEDIEEKEFWQLVSEIKSHGFTYSHEVSEYITRNSLGRKYPHISGILQMKLGSDKWNLEAGFPKNIYARLCRVLGLKNKGSLAKPGAFTPYKDVE